MKPISDYIQTSEFLTEIAKDRTKDNLFNCSMPDSTSGGTNLELLHPIGTDIDPDKLKYAMAEAVSKNRGFFLNTVTTDNSGKRNEKPQGKPGDEKYDPGNHCLDPLAIVADYDNLVVPPTDEQLIELGLPLPTVRVKSGGGDHLWWFLKEDSCTKEQRNKIVERIAIVTRADPKMKSHSRIFRLPGSIHLKNPAEPKLVTITETNYDRRYTSVDFDSFLAATEPKPAPKPKSKSKSKPKSPSTSPSSTEDLPTDGDLPPLDYFFNDRLQEILNGVVLGTQDCDAFEIATEAIGCANWNKKHGRSHIGDPFEYLNKFCDGCTPKIEQSDRDRIWESAIKRKPIPSINSNGYIPLGMVKKWAAWDKQHSEEEPGNPPELWVANKFYRKVLKNFALYDEDLKKWWGYDGKGIWARVGDDSVFKECTNYLEDTVPDPFIPRYVDNVIRFAKSKVLINGLDEPSNLEVMPFGNGVLNIKTKELAPHTPTNKFTWQLPRNYLPEKTEWNEIKKFISSSLNDNQQLVELAIAICNAVLIGRYDLQKSFVLKGSGRNGKGAFMKLLTMLVGEVNRCSTSMKTLNDNNFEVANLFNKRLAIMPDEDKQSGSVSIFKKVVGGDELRAERKYEHPFSFQFKGIIVIAANQPIFVSEKGLAVQERLVYLPFDKFIEAEDRIELEPVFNREMEAFTNYLLSLDDNWVKRTINNANNIKEVKDLSWDIMVESDSIAAFYDDKLITGTAKGDTINSSFAYELYKYYCETFRLKAKAQNTFGKQLIEVAKSQGATVTRHRSKDGVAFIGIRARTHKDIDDKIQELDPEVTYVDWSKHTTDGKLDREWR